jgi:hypothetical protein
VADLNDILEAHAGKGGKLTTKLLDWLPSDDEEDASPRQKYMLIEGDPSSLRFLGEVLIAFATQDQGDTFFIHPTGPGLTHFDIASSCGIYLAKTSKETTQL